ncbi:hypothetical protein [Thermaurantiacus sp.]
MRPFILATVLALAAGPAPAQSGGKAVGDLFRGMSAEGRRIMTEAHLGALDEDRRRAFEAARARTFDVVLRDPLDEAALRAALDAEAEILKAGTDARRDRLIAAFVKLSPADRRAYVAASRNAPAPR